MNMEAALAVSAYCTMPSPFAMTSITLPSSPWYWLPSTATSAYTSWRALLMMSPRSICPTRAAAVAVNSAPLSSCTPLTELPETDAMRILEPVWADAYTSPSAMPM